MANLGLARVRVAFDQIDRAHNHPWRAESALQPVVLMKCLLHGMQLFSVGETLNCGDYRIVCRDGKNAATLHGTTVQVNYATSALTRITSDMSTCQAQFFSQQIDQQHARIDVRIHDIAIHGKRN